MASRTVKRLTPRDTHSSLSARIVDSGLYNPPWYGIGTLIHHWGDCYLLDWTPSAPDFAPCCSELVLLSGGSHHEQRELWEVEKNFESEEEMTDYERKL